MGISFFLFCWHLDYMLLYTMKHKYKKKIFKSTDWKYDPFKIEDDVFDKPLDKHTKDIVNSYKF
jgi:hypothetical protein